MNPAEEILEFVQAAKDAPTLNALQTLVESAVTKLGFEYFSLAHHVIIYKAASDVVFLHNYPPEWAATVHVHEYMRDDPIAEVCARQSAPFRWSEIPSLIQMSPRQRQIMRDARRAGLVNGYTVPIHVAGEANGSCNFCTAGELPEGSLAAAMSIGVIAFDRARRLVRRDPAPAGRLRLTARERDCLLLAGRGSSDREISQILGIGEGAVSGHIEEARRRYGAATRMELVVRALYRSDLQFSDLLDVEDELAGRPVARRAEAADDEPAPMARLGALFFGTNPNLN